MSVIVTLMKEITWISRRRFLLEFNFVPNVQQELP